MIGNRAQSEVLGIALLIGMVVISTTILAFYGTSSLTEQQRELSIAQAERALEALDAQASSVALGESSVKEVELGIADADGSLDTEPDAGWLRVRTIHPSEGNKTVMNETLGAVVYHQGDKSIGYQAGGIWFGDDDGSAMRSPPEFHYHDKTLVIPLIITQGDGAVFNQVEVTKDGESVRVFPNASQGFKNKLENINAPVVEIKVQSEYYEAWAAFFREETTGGVVTVVDETQTASLTMPTLAGQLALDTGVISTSGAGRFFVAGNSRYIDSYNSSAGSYSETEGSEAFLRSAGDVEMEGSADVRGGIRSGGNVSLAGSATVSGDVEWARSYSESGGASVGGNVTEIDGVKPIPTITWLVNHRVNSTRDMNDNNATSVIVNNELALSAGETGELGPGSYYVKELEVERSELVLNTTDGAVTLAVRDWVRLTDSQPGEVSRIRVEGDGIARIFVASRDTVQVTPTGLGNRDVHLHVGKGAAIDVPAENSTQVRIFGPTPFKATVAGSNGKLASVDAIIYAPAGRSGTGYIWVKHGDVFGAVSVGDVTVGQNGGIHFNQATAGATLNIIPDISDIDYMHVSKRRINVTS